MAKLIVDVEDEVVEFFRARLDDMPVEVYMACLMELLYRQMKED